MKVIAYIAMISLFFLTGVESKRHAFYVSITQLELRVDTLQMSLRIFTEDLEFALNELGEEKVFLNEPSHQSRNSVHLRDYLEARFSVGNGVKNLPIRWLGHEFEEDVCWIYGEAIIPQEQSILFIRNEILMEAFPSQQNIIHFLRGDETETKLATKSDPEVRFAKN